MREFLTKGDKVVVISPSEAIKEDSESKDLVSRGAKNLDNIGLNVSYGAHFIQKLYSKSGNPKERASDLERAFENSDIKAIFCSQGGHNSNELLPILNWKLIKDNPKLFFGMSDITVLLNAIYKKTGLVTYHGIDLMWGLGKNATKYSINNLKKLMFSGTHVYEKHPDYPEWKSLRDGVGKGICLGGCLPSFTLLLGTDYDPISSIKEPFILLVESIGESPTRIESHITQLVQQPNFGKYCSGVIIGNFFMCEDEDGVDNRQVSSVIFDQLKEFDFPIIEIKELGHAVENILFPIGGSITIKANDKKVEIL